ncbi:MAG: hypothetical protein ACIWVG_13260 [Gloeotrichia echinulata HAB0833]
MRLPNFRDSRSGRLSVPERIVNSRQSVVIANEKVACEATPQDVRKDVP